LTKGDSLSSIGGSIRRFPASGFQLTMNNPFSRQLRFSICGVSAAALIFLTGNAYSTTRTVSQNGDSGPGSLRQAIADSAANDTIFFSVTGAITLTSGTITINKNLVITGPGARKLKVTGFAGASIFSITSGNVTISGLTVGPGKLGITLTGPGSLTMNDSAVSGNAPDGGILTGTNTILIMNGCTISGNQISLVGGGGLQNKGTATLTNCTISGNTSKVTIGQVGGGGSGGIFNYDGMLTLKSCTVTGNLGEAGAGGIGTTGVSTQLTNTILANNTINPGLFGVDLYGPGFSSGGYNLIGIQDASVGFTNNVNHDIVGTAASPRDPLLLPLQDNGGGTDTAAIFASASPAYNKGNSALATARDQRGYLRPDTADIGACEFLGTQPVTLANISSRAVVQTGDNVLIGGFIVTGSQLKRVIFRAIGPSLSLPGKLSDPVLELYSGNQLITSNDDWGSAPNPQEITATGVAPTNVKESAILTSLAPGSYTAIVRGAGGATGIGVVEAYDLDRIVGSRLANISTRAAVQTGDNVLIGGFIVQGPDSLPVIVRGIGPSLNVPNPMLDPKLELHDVNGATVAANDNWRSAQEAAIIATTIPPTNDAESAIVMTLPPGNYTAILSGVDNTTGVAVVEVYGLL
jgi:hypothetical protein